MNHCGTQTLESKRLILRKFVHEDARAMYNNWANDGEVCKFLTWQPHESIQVSQSVIDEWIKNYERNDFYQWAIVLKENGDQPIGGISVVSMNEKVKMAHFGYCLGRRWWNKGIMTEALQAVMNFLFDVVGFNRIESRHDPNNPASGKVMQHCGMKYEGTLRSSDWSNQGICDACYYALLKGERKN